jgi:hypothetical protein
VLAVASEVTAAPINPIPATVKNSRLVFTVVPPAN